MKKVILVHAPWCAACQPMKTWWFQQTVPEGVEIEMMEADDPELEKSGISSLPTILFLNEEGAEETRATGVKTEQEIATIIKMLRW